MNQHSSTRHNSLHIRTIHGGMTHEFWRESWPPPAGTPAGPTPCVAHGGGLPFAKRSIELRSVQDGNNALTPSCRSYGSRTEQPPPCTCVSVIMIITREKARKDWPGSDDWLKFPVEIGHWSTNIPLPPPLLSDNEVRHSAARRSRGPRGRQPRVRPLHPERQQPAALQGPPKPRHAAAADAKHDARWRWYAWIYADADMLVCRLTCRPFSFSVCVVCAGLADVDLSKALEFAAANSNVMAEYKSLNGFLNAAAFGSL